MMMMMMAVACWLKTGQQLGLSLLSHPSLPIEREPRLVGRRASPAMAPLAGQLILGTFLGGPTCLACKGLFERSRCVGTADLAWVELGSSPGGPTGLACEGLFELSRWVSMS